MGRHNRYTDAYKASLLKQMTGPERKSANQLSLETGVPQQTLSTWKRQAEAKPVISTSSILETPVSYERKLEILNALAGLDINAQGAYLREAGVTPKQVQHWQDALSGIVTDRALRKENRALARELTRKEKALAEAAALLILKKKVDTMLSVDEDAYIPERSACDC